MDTPIQSFDDRRDFVIPGDYRKTIDFCIEHFLAVGNRAIEEHGSFFVALSGGSTPKAIFEGLCKKENSHRLDWKKTFIFWSDERAVPPADTESNYGTAMTAGLSSLPIPSNQIFRMEAERDIESGALHYEQLIRDKVPNQSFDLMMLGMGDDGHTASLFPKTHGLETRDKLAIANYIPQKDAWRMSLTFECINAAKNISIYVLGKNKADMVDKVLNGPYNPSILPVQKVGTSSHKALWILDSDAALRLA